jgi:type II restriction/modification system DNA methylase subunit YeeA
MPVNTAALKTFAPAMRRQLLEAVGRKLDLLLNSQTPDTLSTYAKQIAELREQEEKNREQLLERVAYTWFNRLCALRYLDARGWHPFGCKVLMPAAEGETQPELLKLMRAGNLPADLQSHTDEGRLHGLLDGQIQTAIPGADPQGEVYRQLVLAVCRCYHELLPNLFEGLDDASELLLPDDLLSDGSIVGDFRKEITDDDCQDVESLGWLYQFYIAEKKDEVMARKKAVPTEDIPAVTQLFTPHWIVRYLVENSLGRLWLLNRPGSKLREQMPYYIEGETETDFLVINKPEEIKLLDPACGSGHMLTYAFDLLVLIYEEEGYSPNEIPGLILKNNLHGLEICPRAAQLAELALVFKAREKSRRFFQSEQLVSPQILELQDVRLHPDELNDYIQALGLGELFDPSLFKLLHQFEEAKVFGSLIQPVIDEQAIANAFCGIATVDLDSQLILKKTHLKILQVLGQAKALTQHYQVVVANPPYMGGKGMNPALRKFAQDSYTDSKSDLFAMFMERGLELISKKGFMGMINLPSWLFLSSYESLRERLVNDYSIESMLHMGRGIFGIDWGSVAFVVQKAIQVGRKAHFFKLHKRNFQHLYQDDIGKLFLHANADHFYKYDFDEYRDKEGTSDIPPQSNSNGQRIHYLGSPSEFRKISGSPIAYWLSSEFIAAFVNGKPLHSYAVPRQGFATGDNGRFLRYWHEVANANMKLDSKDSEDARQSGVRWFPCNKGGPFRKWYGNNSIIANWQNDGAEMREFAGSVIRNPTYYFREGITWSTISSTSLSMRHSPPGFLFETKGSVCFQLGENAIEIILGLMNTKVVEKALLAISPTLDYHEGPIGRIPIIEPDLESVGLLVNSAVELARSDWDNFENSWDFCDQPLLRPGLKGATLEKSWRNWAAQCNSAISRMQELETENNRLFIDAYGLGGELQPEVTEDQITLARAEACKDAVAFLSYATGCMMGRYSLDQPGLILADSCDSQAAQLTSYEEKVGKPLSEVQFKPDPDGIIPVLDGEWFEDDIVARTREFLEVTFPESTVTENLRFIEDSLGKDIRKYFCSEFYKDHLQTYKKRPIYWIVQSPKKGFACLIYLHRYTKDTLNQVLNNYFRPYLQKLEARLAQLGLDQLNDDLPARERTAARKEAEKITKVLKECQAWEQDALLPLAQQRIELDLDDGVKVNYLKLQDVLAPIPGLAAKED